NAISQYDKSSRSSLVMVFSGSSEMRFNLWSAVKFTPAMQLGREKQKGFYGEYNGVPVYTAFNSAIDGVMLFVREDATFVDIQEPVVEVREFTEEERQNLTQRANVTVEKLREEVFVSIHITYKLAVSNNCESIVLSLGNEKISDL
ncbi:MAG TPA: hypothetical protein VHP63_07010, partial [candidate division Zixibacteria bacterium]|nr:hypothetical protein [candidate division Zixibacteria bacterium]